MSNNQKCPIDHNTHSSFNLLDGQDIKQNDTTKQEVTILERKFGLPIYSSCLDEERQISSIPKADKKSNWVYPSEKMFYEAMKRKNHHVNHEDMKTVVPIHNAVNEKAWVHILDWEKGYIKYVRYLF